MSTNLGYRERERQRKRESRSTGQRSSTRKGARAREKKKQKETFFVEEEHEILQFKYPRVSAANGEKMRNASGHQGENERQGKKGEQGHIQHFLHKTCN